MKTFNIRISHNTIDIVYHNNFSLFRNSFDKNDGTFPYVESDDMIYVTVDDDNGKIIGILAFALYDSLSQYREAHDDTKHKKYAHIFDLEVLPQYRGKGLLSAMINTCIKICHNEKQKGITLMAKDKLLAKTYNKKYGFGIYDNEDSDSPMMELKL